MLERLLKRGANPNLTDASGATALMWSVPDQGKVQRLLARGANGERPIGKLQRTALIASP